MREDVRRIAVLRANAVGDLVFALPALDALRARFAAADIVLLGTPWHAELLANRPSPVDRVEVIPEGAVPGSATAGSAVTRAFLARMRGERFDLALQLHGGGRHTNPFVRALGATLSAGMRTADAEPLDRWIPYVYHQPEIARYLEVVGLVDARPVTVEPALAVTERDVRASAGAVEPDGRPLVVLHPGATDPRRRWPPSSFGAVGDALASRGARIVVTGTGAEREVVEGVAVAMRHPAVPACGVVGLSGLVGLLARASLVVANDTGPLHLSGAIGTPTVGIYWCGNLVNGGPLSVDRRRHATSWRLSCPVCGSDATRTRCEHDASFVADVPIEYVLDAATNLLERHPLRADDSAGLSSRAAGRSAGSSARRPRDPEASSAPPGDRRRTA